MNCSIVETFSASADVIEAPSELAAKLRRADAHIIMAVAAAHQVLANHRLLLGENGESCGLVFGSSFGPMETNFKVLDQVVFGQPTSPTLFSHSVFNGAAGYIASTLGIRGSSLSVTDFGFPFFNSLQQARLLLAGSRLNCCLVVQVETYSRLLEDARKTHVPDSLPWRQGAVCWLLKKEQEDSTGALVIESLEVSFAQAEKSTFPVVEETLTVNGNRYNCRTGLATAGVLTEMIQVGAGKRYDCRIESTSGTVCLKLGW